jgi:hypothetical protein
VITADTITDKQLRELREESASFGLDDIESWCDVALGHHNPGYLTKNACRARCAEILNARLPKETK